MGFKTVDGHTLGKDPRKTTAQASLFETRSSHTMALRKQSYTLRTHPTFNPLTRKLRPAFKLSLKIHTQKAMATSPTRLPALKILLCSMHCVPSVRPMLLWCTPGARSTWVRRFVRVQMLLLLLGSLGQRVGLVS